jgi:NADPH-dependent 2,4-dienoyl-CoA reductase/sulfur reductase-like enzyme
MPHESFDLVIIGAGPAGMAAATVAAAAGLSVRVLDEQTAVGGQIYRGIGTASAAQKQVLGPDYTAGALLAQAFARAATPLGGSAAMLSHETGASVWQVTREHTVHYLQHGVVKSVAAQRVLFATGAMERPFPIPGWTLPGVMGAGAAQILLKSAAEVPRAPVVLAGCGPLLYLLGWQYLRAGVPIKALVDTTRSADRWRAKGHLLSALRAWPDLSKGLALLRALRRADVPMIEAADDLRIEGEQQARALSFSVRGQAQRIEAELILLHQGVVPNTQFTWSIRAGHRWHEAQLCWVPNTDAWGELDVPGFFVAGDGAGIAGARAAAVQGRLAALAIAVQLGARTAAQIEAQAAQLRVQLAQCLRIRPLLDTLYRPRDENRMPADPVIVCRCEEVTAGELRRYVEIGCTGPNQAKAFGRCGMGPCQGRLCGLSVTEIIAQARGVTPAEVGYYRIRPPIKPLTLGELASEAPQDAAHE